MAIKFTLKQLRYFVVVAQHSSVTKAAELMFVSQPSISSAISHLEQVTGLQLFIRHHAQGLSLTIQGNQFYFRAKKLLDDADGLEKFAETLGEEVTGTINVVGFPTFTSLMMPSMLKQFVDKYPEVNVQCDEMHQANIIEGLLKCQYELAITYDMQLPDSIDFIPLISLPPYAVVSTHHPLAKLKSIPIHQLAQYEMVMLDWPMSKEYFNSLFFSQGTTPKVAYNAHSLGMVQGLVANGFGYSLFNTPIHTDVALDGSQFLAIPIEEELMPLTMGVAKLKQSRLSPAGNAFVDMLKDYAVQVLQSTSKLPQKSNSSLANLKLVEG